jgi:TIR domain
VSAQESRFELPKNIERCLAMLSTMYGREGRRQLQEIIVNAKIRVHEGWSTDNWNGGTYGHALYLELPEPLFAACVKQKLQLEEKLRLDLNSIQSIQGEFIEKVFLEVEIDHDEDWRKHSGVLMVGKKPISQAAEKRIWEEPNTFRVFLSHKSEVKKETAEIKEGLRPFGVSCFVAHVDIHPTQLWQDDIESALCSMDAFAALLTYTFHESEWTDQEMGFAFARGVPIVAVRLGRDPYGFIRKFQGLASSWSNCAVDLAKVLINNDRMLAAYLRALPACRNWDTANKLAKVLPEIERLSHNQIDELVTAFNGIGELRGAFGFNGNNPYGYGDGLVPHLNRLGPRRFYISSDGRIEQSK